MSVEILERPEIIPVESRQQVKILIIDDDEIMAHKLAVRLRRQGFEPVWADCGEAGLALARAQRPTLVVLDLRLPDADGLAICEQLVDDPATCGIPVIAISGQEVPDAVRRCRAAGSHFFLARPFDPSVLMVLICHAIADTASWGDPSERASAFHFDRWSPLAEWRP